MLKKILLFLFVSLMLLGLSGCSKEETVEFNCVDDLNGRSIGVLTGSIVNQCVSTRFPESEINEFSDITDAIAALKQGKIDATVYDLTMIKDICNANDELTYFSDVLMSVEYGSIFPKSENGLARRNDYNAFLNELQQSGELETIKKKWMQEECQETFDYENLDDTNGKLVIATDGQAYPMAFFSDGKLTGMEIELFYRYCLNRGYGLEIMQCNFAGILTAVASEKADVGAGAIICTEERKESLYFSDIYSSSTYHMIVRKENMTNEFNTLSDLKGKTLADLTGSANGAMAEQAIDDVKLDYFNSTSDMIEAVLSNKAQGALVPESTYSTDLANRDDLRILDIVGYEECGYFFPQTDEGNQLKEKFNAFLQESEENGTISALDEKWADTTTEKHLDYDCLTGENGTLKYACSSVVGEPACYVYDNEVTGKEVELVLLFVKEYGYDLEIIDYSFSGMLQAIASDMADIGGSNTAITSERAETVNFSEPFYRNPIYVVVKNETADKEETNFFESIKESFEKTFIKEDRYKLFAQGIVATLEISFVSVVAGLILGVLLFSLYYMHRPIVNRLLELLSSLLSDTPTVVLLMVFYYLIFSDSVLGGLEVSMVAFSVLFGFTSLGILKTCFASVDKGQFEAAWALGYGKMQAIFKIIVPEILPVFFTLFTSEIVSLIKATSIVGYIAVQDITKVSDIVRSRTYEPFFPLIVTTVLYILVIVLFKKVILLIANYFNTRKSGKSNLLKGVKQDD